MNTSTPSSAQNDPSNSTGRVDLRHIIRTAVRSKFPLAPVGTREAICTDVEIADSAFGNAQSGDKVIRLTWEITTTTKEGGTPKKYTIRAKPLGVYFSSGSALVQLLKILTGTDVSYAPVGQDEEGNPIIDFDAGVFIGMRCSVVITHVQQFGKTYANITEYRTDDTQKAENGKRLSS